MNTQNHTAVSPVIVFTYNRPEHTKRTIEALAANELADLTELFIFSDAAKKETDEEKVRAIRAFAKSIEGFAKVTLVAREENFGLAKNVIRGVTDVINRYGKVIVLEDDLVTNRFFLRFMNDGLNRYQREQKVTGITGFSHFGDSISIKEECVFHTLTGTSWSWATWEDRWAYFDEACSDWIDMKNDKALRKRFNYDNTYDFYKIMKMQQTMQNHNSWAIRWYWTNFKKGGYILSPVKSLVSNEGWDGSGVHCGAKAKPAFDHALKTQKAISQFPGEIKETKETHRQMKRALIKEWEPSLIRRIYHIVRRKNYIGEI